MEHDPSTKHILEGRELIDYLVEKASGATNAELLQREERRNRRNAAIFSVIGFIGVGAIVGAIKMFVQQEVERNVVQSEQRIVDQVTETLQAQLRVQHDEFADTITTEVAEKVNQRVGNVRRELANYKVYQELIAQSQTVKELVARGEIPNEPLRIAFEEIQKLADVEQITSQPRFLEAVNTIMDVFVRTDRAREIDRLESQLRDVLVNHLKISLDLTDHYGQVIVSSPYPLEKLQGEYAALKRYAQASRELRYPEKALMWELFVAFKGSDYQATRTTETMIEMVQDLSEADLNSFCYNLVKNSDPLYWMQVPDHEGRELARLVNGLIASHPKLGRIVAKQSATAALADRIALLTARRQRRLDAMILDSERTPAQASDSTPVVETASAAGGANTLRR